jgi:hypothetical protein
MCILLGRNKIVIIMQMQLSLQQLSPTRHLGEARSDWIYIALSKNLHLETLTELNSDNLPVIITTSAHVSTMPPVQRLSPHVNCINPLDSQPSLSSPLLTAKDINLSAETLTYHADPKEI